MGLSLFPVESVEVLGDCVPDADSGDVERFELGHVVKRVLKLAENQLPTNQGPKPELFSASCIKTYQSDSKIITVEGRFCT